MLRNPPRLLALALFAATLGAVARGPRGEARGDEPPPPRESQFFEKYDTNLDGKVTLEEFTAGSGDAASFGLIDKNKDNVVSPDELGLPADYKPRPRAERRPEAAPGKPGAAPGGRGEEMRKRLREMDADGDGRVSRAEWKGEAEGFDRFDVNKDGFLDKDDRPAGGKGMPGGGAPPFDGAAVLARWKKMDRDGDGKVSKDEYTGDFAFEGLDTDKDGFLTEADAKALAERMGAERPGAGGANPGGPGMPPGGPGRMPTPEEVEKRFAEMDRDQSGKVESAEMPEMLRERLLKADADGDGALSKEEFGEGMKKALRRDGAGPGKGPGTRPDGQGAGPEILKRFDTDHDGRVERDQFPGSDEAFAKLDKDGDGVLTEKDFPKPPPGGKGPDGAGPGKDGPPGKGPPPDAPPKGPPKSPPPQDMIGTCDKDGDGRLSRAEFRGTDAEWRTLDKNQDGWISADEAPKPE